ncbi:MAG: AEC family transporter [Spirochaetales bacterium]|nr:AEC family transporter [Candidatus Physcosoma equi]
MDNLVFSLNVTMPVFLLMVLGYFLKKVGLLDEAFSQKLNKFVFTLPLPMVLFKDLAVLDLATSWNTKFVLFCFVVTILSIVISYLMSFLWKDKSIRGEYVQASYRSSAAILGVAFIQNMYGSSAMGPLMVLGSVPLYNIMAVMVLNLMKPDGSGRLTLDTMKKTLKGVVTNPILIGVAAGFLWSAFRIPMKGILLKTVSNISSLATPLGLLAMGATFDFRKLSGKLLPSVIASLSKLCLFVLVFLPLAVLLGFRNEALMAILVMLGSATTVSAYVMAKSMGHEGTLTSTTVALTTLFAAFTLTLWIFILKSLAFI